MLSCNKKIFLFLFLFTHLYSENYPKIGLVLSGGGSKGFAHIATLKALDSLQIPIDYISGTSFGAIVGAMYALGYSGKQIEKMAIETDWYEVQKDEPERKYLPHFRKKDTGKYQLEFGLKGFTPIAPTGLIYGQKIILELSKWTREFEQVYDFDRLPIPFRCNAFDIISGKEIILKEGSLAHALRASLSIPTIFAPVEWGDALLVDGGVANNLPVDIVREMGADYVIAIDVTQTTKSKSKLKNIYDIVDQTISVHGYEKKQQSIEDADLYVRPQIDEISFTDYRPTTMQYLFERGEEAVQSNWDLFLNLKKLTSLRKQKIQNIQPLAKPIINEIIIDGNESLSKAFIKSFIGLKKGMRLNPSILDDSIAELYSLGYFKILYYEIHGSGDNQVDVIIRVHETPLRKFHMGLRWDNLYHMIGTANVQLTSDLFPGFRIENQMQVGGLFSNKLMITYPSRRLNFPIYPFLKINNSKHTFNLHSAELGWGNTYNYTSREIGVGIGVLLKNYWNTEFEYILSKDNFQSQYDQVNNGDNDIDPLAINNKNLAGLRIVAQLDLLDDILLPKEGIILKAKYEHASNTLGSTRDYQFYHAWGKAHKTFRLNTYAISGYHHQATTNTPRYLTTLHGGNHVFAGAEEFQLHGTSLTFIRIDYRYKHKKDIFAHLIINWFINAESEDSDHVANNIWGFGTGITLLSPLGPLEFIWSWGPKNIYSDDNLQNLFHFSAGFKF